MYGGRILHVFHPMISYMYSPSLHTCALFEEVLISFFQFWPMKYDDSGAVWLQICVCVAVWYGVRVLDSTKYSTSWIHTHIWACACACRFEVGCQNPAYDNAIHSSYHCDRISNVYSGASNTATAAECNCICVCVAVRYGCQNPTYDHSIALFHACTLMKHTRRQRRVWLHMGVRGSWTWVSDSSKHFIASCHTCISRYARAWQFEVGCQHPVVPTTWFSL